MAGRENEIDKRPRMSYGGGSVVTSGATLSPIPQYFIINVTTATTITFTMMDGNTVALGSLPIGVYRFDVQASTVTVGTPANAVVAGFYNP